MTMSRWRKRALAAEFKTAEALAQTDALRKENAELKAAAKKEKA